MATPTVRDLIRRSLLLIGAVAVGETPSADEEQDALQTLNELLDSWATERLMVYTITRTVFALVPGLQMHSLGAGGNFNIARPAKVERAGLIVNVAETPIEVIESEQWAAINNKLAPGTPYKVWDDGEYPLRRLWFWPVPQAGQSVALYTWTQISQFASVNATAVFPPGYAKALRYSLATELAGEYEKEISSVILSHALHARSVVRSLNLPAPIMGMDDALVGSRGFNINTGAA